MTDLTFDGKVAIITGAGGGLGREHALLLARRGARIVVNDLGGSVDGDGRRRLGRRSTSSRRSRPRAARPSPTTTRVATARGRRGHRRRPRSTRSARVDIVINNAGILRDKTFHNMTPDLVDPVLDVHLRGAFYVTQPAWLHMREQGYGRVVNTASNSGILGNFGQANYGAAKMGLVGFTRVLANEGAQAQHQGQRHRPGRPHPHDRGAARPARRQARPRSSSRPIVAWLAHEDCPVTGEVYSRRRRRVARFFIGLTEGYFKDGPHGRGRPRQLRPDPRRGGLHRPRRSERRARQAAQAAHQLTPNRTIRRREPRVRLGLLRVRPSPDRRHPSRRTPAVLPARSGPWRPTPRPGPSCRSAGRALPSRRRT